MQSTASNRKDDQVPAAERITVALVAKAAEDLRRTQVDTGLSKTDVVNRAVSAYRFFEEKLAAGSDLILRDPESGQEQLVHFL